MCIQIFVFSPETPQYNEKERKMWDLGRDRFESFEGLDILEVANLSLDRPDLEAMIFMDGDEDEAIEVCLNKKKA